MQVLSINKALSIQAHPNMETAQILHSTTPDKYPDPNHKPEMVIALTDFKGLCGFRPLAEIKQFILNIPELKNVISEYGIIISRCCCCCCYCCYCCYCYYY